MSHTIEISDDESMVLEKPHSYDCVISSDEENCAPEISSDEEPPIPSVKKTRQQLLNNMFPRSISNIDSSPTKSKGKGPSNIPEAPKNPGFKKMIGGIEVNLPVDPYGSQIALMFKV